MRGENFHPPSGKVRPFAGPGEPLASRKACPAKGVILSPALALRTGSAKDIGFGSF